MKLRNQSQTNEKKCWERGGWEVAASKKSLAGCCWKQNTGLVIPLVYSLWHLKLHLFYLAIITDELLIISWYLSKNTWYQIMEKSQIFITTGTNNPNYNYGPCPTGTVGEAIVALMLLPLLWPWCAAIDDGLLYKWCCSTAEPHLSSGYPPCPIFRHPTVLWYP